MVDAIWQTAPENEPFGNHAFGDRLDWDSPSISVFLAVELPFWLMVPSSPLRVTVSRYEFDVEIRGDHYELHSPEFTDSRQTCVYLGPDPSKLNEDIVKEIEEEGAPAIIRKCKTVLRIPTACLADAVAAVGQSHWRTEEALAYFRSLAAAHIPVVNQVVRRYRLATYDYFPFEVSPWDVPVWFLQSPEGHVMVALFPYAQWDYKPNVNDEMYTLVTAAELQAASDQAGPGELDLLDGLTMMEHGDYSGAVRRVTTALEVLVEDRLREALSVAHSDDEVERRLEGSRTDFPGRLRQLSKLAGGGLPAHLAEELERTRSLRHEIVHRGRRLTHLDRGSAQRCVDTSRWAYNFIEGRPARAKVREERVALRSVGRFALTPLFDAEITDLGPVVYPPKFDGSADS